jgi:hypothetical protein
MAVTKRQANRRWRALIILLFVLISAYAAAWVHGLRGHGIEKDSGFSGHRQAGILLEKGSGPLLYDASFMQGRPYDHPPFAAIPVGLTARWPTWVVYGIYAVIQAGMVALATILFRPLYSKWRRTERIALGAAVAAYWPVFVSIRGGEIAGPILLCIALSWRCQREGIYTAAGGALALAASGPLSVFPLIWGQLVRRRWTVILGVAAGGGALLLSSISVSRLSGTIQYLRGFPARSANTSFAAHDQAGLGSVITSLTGRTDAAKWSTVIVAGSAMGLLTLIWRPPKRSASRLNSKTSEDWRWAFTMALTALACPGLRTADMLLLAPPAIVAYDRFRRTSMGTAIAAMVLVASPIWAAADHFGWSSLISAGLALTLTAALWKSRPTI